MADKPRYRVAAHADGRVRSVREIAPSKVGAMNLAGSSLGGGYEAAQRQRRLFSFRPSEAGPSSLIIFAGQTLRARARYLVRNNPYARKAQRVFVSNLVGTGIRPIPLGSDETVKTAISQAWEEWVFEADADALTDFYGLQVLVARAMFDAGECFIRFRSRRPEDGLSVPLQLQILESEFCPYELNMRADNGNMVKGGIEFDAIGRRVAYYFWRTHPGEYAIPADQVGWTRVPASDVLHLFEPLRPGQIRGVSWLSAAIVRAWLLDQYDDAELERKKTAALFAGFITRPDNSSDDPPLGQQDQPAVGTADTSLNADGEAIAGLSPGMLQVLMQGEGITFSEPADVGPNYEAFEYRALLAMCAGMDLPYANVTGDYSKANYSSLRASLLDMRLAVKQLQRTVMMFQLCRPVLARFVEEAVLSKSLPIKASAFNAARRDFTTAKWIPPRMEWVDPEKDVRAEQAAVRSGFESREAVILSRGATLEEMDEAIERSNVSADARGLVLDSDPRRTNARGSGNAPDTAAPTASIAPGEDDAAADPAGADEAA